jgi:hypothetical protein
MKRLLFALWLLVLGVAASTVWRSARLRFLQPPVERVAEEPGAPARPSAAVPQ